jgi:hypothetical protein
MVPRVQLAIADGAYVLALREALARSCAWHVEAVDRADPTRPGVIVLDHAAFECLPLPLSSPERMVLVTHKDPEHLAEAWEAGIVSIVSENDPMNTVMLAIMAAGLRIDKPHPAQAVSGISPSLAGTAAPIPPVNRTSGSKRWKTQ